MLLMYYYLVWLVVKRLLPVVGGGCGCFYCIITWCGLLLKDYYLMVVKGLLPDSGGSCGCF